MCKSKKVYIVSTLIPLLIGWLAALLGMNGMAEYSQLIKPPLAPPGSLFGIVWTILYILMGISSALIYCSRAPQRENAIGVYAVQLAANFMWTIFFFVFRWRLFSLLWILLLTALVALMIRQFYKIQPLAAYLQIPYLVWILFAAYLNLGIWYLNR